MLIEKLWLFLGWTEACMLMVEIIQWWVEIEGMLMDYMRIIISEWWKIIANWDMIESGGDDQWGPGHLGCWNRSWWLAVGIISSVEKCCISFPPLSSSSDATPLTLDTKWYAKGASANYEGGKTSRNWCKREYHTTKSSDYKLWATSWDVQFWCMFFPFFSFVRRSPQQETYKTEMERVGKDHG